MTFMPRPTWLISSTPQARPTSIEPPLISALTTLLACCPLPHCTSIVVPVVE